MLAAAQLAMMRTRWRDDHAGSVEYTIYRMTRDSDGAGGSIDVPVSVGTCKGRVIKGKPNQRQEGDLIKNVDTWTLCAEFGADLQPGDSLRPVTPDGWEYTLLGTDTGRSDATHLECPVERRAL